MHETFQSTQVEVTWYNEEEHLKKSFDEENGRFLEVYEEEDRWLYYQEDTFNNAKLCRITLYVSRFTI